MVHVQGVEGLRSSVYLGMVTKLAWKTWQKLPVHTRAWITIDDMVLDGLRWVEMSGWKRWNRRRGSMTTIIYVGVSNYFYDHYLLRYAITKKTQEWDVLSIQAKEQEARERGKDFEFERVFGIRTKTQNEIEQQFLNCLAGEKLLALYQVASPTTKKSIQEWFFRYAIWMPKEVQTRLEQRGWRTKTEDFKKAATEFRELAAPQGITIHDCRHLLSSPLCLEQMSRKLTGLPYAWDVPVGR